MNENICGCDLHTRYQVVAWIEEETGEIRAGWHTRTVRRELFTPVGREGHGRFR